MTNPVQYRPTLTVLHAEVGIGLDGTPVVFLDTREGVRMALRGDETAMLEIRESIEKLICGVPSATGDRVARPITEDRSAIFSINLKRLSNAMATSPLPPAAATARSSQSTYPPSSEPHTDHVQRTHPPISRPIVDVLSSHLDYPTMLRSRSWRDRNHLIHG